MKLKITRNNEAFGGEWLYDLFEGGVEPIIKALPTQVSAAEMIGTSPADGLSDNTVVLLGWPNKESGLVMGLRINAAQEQAELSAVWPNLANGLLYDVNLEGLILSDDGVEGAAEVTLPDHDQIELAFTDVHFAISHGDYLSPGPRRARIIGLALGLKWADCTPVVIGPEAPSYAMMVKNGATVDHDGKIRLKTDQMAALLPHDLAPQAFQIRGPVTAIRDDKTGVMGQSLRLLTVTVARPIQGNDLDLMVAVTPHLWPDCGKVQVGDSIQGVVLLQGRFTPLAP